MYILFLFIIFLCLILCWGPHLYYLWISSKSLFKKKYLSIYCSEVLLQKYSQLPTQYNTLEDGERVLTFITTFLPSYIPIFKKFFGHCPVCFWKCAAYVFCLQGANFQWLTNNVWFQKISIPVPTPQDFPFQRVFDDLPPSPFPHGISRIFERGLLFTLRNSKWFWYFKKKKVNTRSVMKYCKILLQQWNFCQTY